MSSENRRKMPDRFYYIPGKITSQKMREGEGFVGEYAIVSVKTGPKESFEHSELGQWLLEVIAFFQEKIDPT